MDGRTGDVGRPVHRDVNGKCLALLVLFALSLCAMRLALAIPPAATATSVRGSVKGRPPEAPAAVAAPGAVSVLGLDYMVPGGGGWPRGSGWPGIGGWPGRLDALRDGGRLKGYSLPARMLAFTPDGDFIYIPPWPRLAGPSGAPVVFNGTRDGKRVALTFDTSDVAEPAASRALLEELSRLRVPATFFVCGPWCLKNPGVLKDMVSRGFEIGNHSWSHPRFTRLPDDAVVAELSRTEEAFREVTGGDIAAYFRPPYGDYDARVRQLVAGRGYVTVMWERDTLDWEPATTADQIVSRATDGVSGGEIILMHTLGRNTAGSLDRVVGKLRSRGFTLTTVSGVLEP